MGKIDKSKKYFFEPIVLLICINTLSVFADSITPSPYWKNQLTFPNDTFQVKGPSENDPAWVKFTILRVGGYDPNIVYYQDCQQYPFHYEFATDLLDPFAGMTQSEFYNIALYQSGQQAILGAVILPPCSADPCVPDFNEYGIQFIRYDPYTPQEILDMFNLVKSTILAEPDVNALYFPAYQQLPIAETNKDWLASQGVIVSSPARWAEGNVCYSQGWALGELKYFPPDQIDIAYNNGQLLPSDILLTDGVPPEIPFVSGIITLSPSTPSSHVAILAQTFAVPFTYLAAQENIDKAQQLVGRTIFLSVSNENGICNVGIKDVQDILTEQEKQQILSLKEPAELNIQPIAPYGSYYADANNLLPADIKYFGGKAANYGILRQSIDSNCPKAMAFSFNLWSNFLEQAINPVPSIILKPGQHLLFWADDDPEQGPTHTNFKLSGDGESIALFNTDGQTLIDGLAFGPQSDDVSYGRTIDGGDSWQFFASPTPGWANSATSDGNSLVINEFMADNETTIEDPNESGEYPDWIEIYNASDSNITLNGMYLTDDLNDPTKWQIPVIVTQNTLRKEIECRLAKYTAYPPANMQALSEDLAAIRSMITNPYITSFNTELQNAVIDALQNFGLDPFEKIRFRSSTNVEDSEQFTGAGLYASYSGCLADDLDHDDVGPCACDSTKANERGVFRAVRKVFASFYNENAFLERLRRDVNEAEVAMALLMHHSFPDEFELANGVATLEKIVSDPNIYIKLVTQKGAVSVANPEDGSIPEVVDVLCASANDVNASLIQSSNLVILGKTVLDWQSDYNDLSELLVTAANKFEQVTGKTEYILDFEYKKVSPGGAAIPAGGLVVKQIRQLPKSEQTPNVTTPLLIGETLELCGWQGPIFSNHRLKSRWTLITKNIWLTEENLNNESLFTDAEIEYAAEGKTRKISAEIPHLPFAQHIFDKNPSIWPYKPLTVDFWHLHHLQNQRTYTLVTRNIPLQVSEYESPLVWLSDIINGPYHLLLQVNYTEPVPSVNYFGDPETTNEDIILLQPPLQLTPDALLQQRYVEKNGISITTQFYWPKEPNGPIGGYTAPLVCFVETTITGYTAEPIVLNDYYSQSYAPEHHNFQEHFLFEPQLEPGISAAILDELKVENIRFIYWFLDFYGSIIRTYGFDEPFNPADLDDDNDTDLIDFAHFALRWFDSVCDDCSSADLTGDGRVDGEDLLEFTFNWLDGIAP